MSNSEFDKILEAVGLLLSAGQAEIAARALRAEQQQSMCGLRRRAVLSAYRNLAEALGGPAAFATSDPQVLETTLDHDEQCALAHELQKQANSRPYLKDQKFSHELAEALTDSLRLLKRAAANDDDRSRHIAATLVRSVLRALSIAMAGVHPEEAEEPMRRIAQALEAASTRVSSIDQDLAELTLRLHNQRACALEIKEAAAALALLCRQSPESVKDKLQPAWMRLAAEEPRIHVAFNGPYLVEGSVEITNHLGVPVETNGLVALCRCGQSNSKPWCDGSHSVSGFTGDKDMHRVPDRRDSYVGQQVVILDNRGICAHSGFCTDRLNSVFHLRQEPWVTPSGDRMDEILRAVRRCPSGALGAAVDETEMREYVDRSRKPAIEISKNGPYRIRGAVPVLDDQGLPVERSAGASEEHYSLCRCGSSLNKPFCSGMHWSVEFTDPVPPDREPTLFEWAGGYPALLDTTTIFYSRHVPSDPVIGPLFARMEADHPERVAAWLSEVFGGPRFYSERHGGYVRMISQHLNKHLTQEQRSHWALLMAQSADEAGLPNDPEFRAAFMAYIEWGSRIAVENSTAEAKPPVGMPVPKWWWVCNATPGARVSALASQPEAAPSSSEPLQPGQSPSFVNHIKSLFRPVDRSSMRFAFDLWSHEDVSKHASVILERVRAGTMPCDGAWPQEKVELFEKWTKKGKQP
jgi:CDGSH-type Zn-finger protein